MTILRRGITGFSESTGKSMPEVLTKKFKEACHTVSRQTGWKLDDFVTSNVTPNFHQAVFHLRSQNVSAICNSVFPVVAFVHLKVLAPPLTFQPQIEFAIEFQRFGYEIPSPEVLLTPIANADLSQLSEVEKVQLKYWKPKTVGDVIYNWFD